MKRKAARRSSLFLLELVAAIFFFCLAAAVCVRFFVKSHTLTEDTKNLDMAVNQASSYAEIFRSEDDFIHFLETQDPDGERSKDETTFTLYYDDDWDPCKKEASAFALVIALKTENTFCSGTFSVSDLETGREIYSLDTGKYTGGEDGS